MCDSRVANKQFNYLTDIMPSASHLEFPLLLLAHLHLSSVKTHAGEAKPVNPSKAWQCRYDLTGKITVSR
jgi:hypothetical protein